MTIHTAMGNATPAFLDEHVAAGGGARPAIVTAESTTTYAELLSLVCRTGNVLRELDELPRTATGKLQRFALRDGVERLEHA